MSFLDRLFGRNQPDEAGRPVPTRGPGGGTARTPDDIALERYRYLLRTAPPDQLEQAHAEAFARLTPEQRQIALQQIAGYVPESELRDASADPRSLARLATRAEVRRPGTIERAWGPGGGRAGGSVEPGAGYRGGLAGGGLGGAGIGSFFLYGIAGAFIGSAIAQTMFQDHGYPPGDPGGDPDTAAANFDDSAAADDPGSAGDDGAAGGDDGGGVADDTGVSSGDRGEMRVAATAASPTLVIWAPPTPATSAAGTSAGATSAGATSAVGTSAGEATSSRPCPGRVAGTIGP